MDLSVFECAVPITDPSVYKKGKRDKIIAYLEENGLALPTFDYKCGLESFYEEFQKLYGDGRP